MHGGGIGAALSESRLGAVQLGAGSVLARLRFWLSTSTMATFGCQVRLSLPLVHTAGNVAIIAENFNGLKF